MTFTPDFQTTEITTLPEFNGKISSTQKTDTTVSGVQTTIRESATSTIASVSSTKSPTQSSIAATTGGSTGLHFRNVATALLPHVLCFWIYTQLVWGNRKRIHDYVTACSTIVKRRAVQGNDRMCAYAERLNKPRTSCYLFVLTILLRWSRLWSRVHFSVSQLWSQSFTKMQRAHTRMLRV